MRKKAMLPIGFAIGGICVAIIFVNVIIVLSVFMVGHGTRESTRAITDNYGVDSGVLQFTSFQIKEVGYDVPVNMTPDCKNTSFTKLNVTSVIWINETYSFSYCKLWINGDMVKGIMIDEDKGKNINIILSDMDVRTEYNFKFCCDDYCNGRMLKAFCR
ncbi:hypothetical protein COV93_08560 [Candidatus Woesearchaeota archaeon CG11_big_fil_rev_8_21_14_0_20_43_8]|nr:MAG: hypothetical protein COV93_08560 [Candidatus Woesearchaeota archaeon CG11_big_fil_rev_8_21_14_0_20_43_8]PIO04726.1 MAG: hypothetical protein COT47_07805 [Candidatus Woesearchaeota archaeon CG08_land_8_20_14_0_20_43_7]